MKSEKARTYFLEHQIPEIKDVRLLYLLDGLSLYRDKILDLKKFSKDLSNIIDLNKISNIKYIIETDKKPEDIQFILDIHAWARKIFSESLINGNIDKLILSYLIGEYLFLDPVIDFYWEYPFGKSEEGLRNLLPKVKIQISIPENAPYHEKKYYKDYRESLSGDSFRKVFDFLSVLENGRGYDYHFTNFVKAIMQICFKINHKLISQIIAKNEPVFIRMIFKALDPYQTNAVLNGYDEQSLLPLLIGLVHIVNPMWNNTYNEQLEKDYDFIGEASLIVKKISERIKTDDVYKYITDCSNIFGNRLWHSIYIACAVKNEILLNSYIINLDFSLGFGTENVFDTFCQYIQDDVVLDDFSVRIYDKYLAYLLEEKNYEYSFCNTLYLRFMIRAVYVKSDKSCEKYGKMLKKVSIDFERSLYSWNMKQVSMCFTNLVFWVLALIFYSMDSDLGKINFSYTIDIFNNKKYLDAFNKVVGDTVIDYRVFADFLQTPASHIIIKLPLSHDSHTTIEFNRDT